MPPRRKAATATEPVACVHISSGVGPITGLQLWRVGGQIALVDASSTGIFAQDVALWNDSLSLKEATLKHIKDARTKQDTA